MWSEATSALRQRVFRSEISPELAEETLSAMLEAPIERAMPTELYRERMRWPPGWGGRRATTPSTLLARLLACPLLTADARLRRGAARVIQTMAPEDL